MADLDIDASQLPDDVREKLAELDLELSEGDITQKGYEKKRSRLLTPYAKQQAHGAGPSAPSPSTAAQRRAQRRLTREDNRYHSEIRTEAVMQALAMHNKKVPVMPLPSKRTSVNYPGQQRRADRHGTGESGTQTPVEQPRIVKKSVQIKVPKTPNVTVVKPNTSASILHKLCVKPSTTTIYKPTSSISTSSSILKTVAPPKNTNPSVSNPVLRHTLSTSMVERQLQEEEQRLKVQFLKRKLEMAEEEHQETLSLLKSKKQYVELKKQKLVQKGLEISGISNDTSCGIQINSVVGNAEMNASTYVNGSHVKVDPLTDQSSDTNSSKDDDL